MSEVRPLTGPLAGYALFVDTDGVGYIGVAGRFPDVPLDSGHLRSLARAYPANSEVWRWLNEKGIARPRVGGPSTPRRERAGVSVEVAIPPALAASLERYCARCGSTKTDAILAGLHWLLQDES